MGVDFYTCAVCECSFPDCGEYVYCNDCGNHFCCDECAKMKPRERFGEELDEEYDDDCYEFSNCCICRKEEANDYILLGVLMRHYNLTKEQVMEFWRQEKDVDDDDDD